MRECILPDIVSKRHLAPTGKNQWDAKSNRKQVEHLNPKEAVDFLKSTWSKHSHLWIRVFLTNPAGDCVHVEVVHSLGKRRKRDLTIGCFRIGPHVLYLAHGIFSPKLQGVIMWWFKSRR